MNQTQEQIIDQFLDDLVRDPLALPPLEMDNQTAHIVRSVVQNERLTVLPDMATQSRVWRQAFAAAEQNAKRHWTRRLQLTFGVSAALAMLLLLTLLLFPSRPPVANAAQIISQAQKVLLDASLTGLKSYQAVICASIQDKNSVGEDTEIQQHVWFNAPDQWRQETYSSRYWLPQSTTPMEGLAMSRPQDHPCSNLRPYRGIEPVSLAVSNGNLAWYYTPGVAQLVDPQQPYTYFLGDLNPAFDVIDIPAILQHAGDQNGNVTLIEPEKVNDRMAYVLQFTYEEAVITDQDRGGRTARMKVQVKLWIDQETYLILQGEKRDTQGTFEQKWKVQSLDLNTPLPAALFKLEIPSHTYLYWRTLLGIIWDNIALRASFAVYHPDWLMLYQPDAKLIPELPRYQVAEHVVQQRWFAVQDLKPALWITEGSQDAVQQSLGQNWQAGQPIRVGDSVGHYWESAGARFVALSLDDTTVVLQGIQDEVPRELLLEYARRLQKLSPPAN